MVSGGKLQTSNKWKNPVWRKTRQIFTVYYSWNPIYPSTLLHDFRYLMVRDKVMQILKETYMPPDKTNQYTQKLLRFIKMHKSIKKAPPAATILATPESMQGWRKAHEIMSLWPSRYHFGHLNVVCQSNYLVDLEDTMTNVRMARVSWYGNYKYPLGTSKEASTRLFESLGNDVTCRKYVRLRGK